MYRQRAMTMVELLVVLLCVLVAVAVVIPLLLVRSPSHPLSRSMQNSTQLRGIQQGLILYSQGNNGWYTGFNSDGKLIDAIPADPGKSYGADKKQGSLVFALLLNGNYFTPGYAISPEESNPAIKALMTPDTVTINNYSYAVSQAENAATDAGRIAEWHDNTNPLAVTLSDRVFDGTAEATGAVPPARQRSLWTRYDGDWKGGVCFGDDSIQYMTTSDIPKTSYGKAINKNDNLFQSSGPSDAFQIRD